MLAKLKKAKSYVYGLALCGASLCASLVHAADGDITVPTNLDLVTFIGNAVTKMALVVAAVIAAYFLFLIIRKGLRWAGKAIG